MKNWILKFHLYGGLLCFCYLIIFGVSSLFYQHHFEFMVNQKEDGGMEIKTINIQNTLSDATLARSIQDSLHIAGWFLPWETYRDSLRIFHTQIENPKTSYRIKYDVTNHNLELSKSHKGFWNILNSLHASLGTMPNAPLMMFWGVYTYICLFVVLFSIVSGIWLFAVSNTESRAGWITFGSVLVLSTLFMIFIYYHG